MNIVHNRWVGVALCVSCCHVTALCVSYNTYDVLSCDNSVNTLMFLMLSHGNTYVLSCDNTYVVYVSCDNSEYTHVHVYTHVLRAVM